MNEPELRITQAHSSDEHSGTLFGLQIALFPWVSLALFAGLAAFVGLFYGAELEFPDALKCAVVPPALVVLYLRLAHQGRPPGFTAELVEQLFTGGHLSPPRQSPPHPYHHDQSVS
jgi:hypothetical protein